jgi:hypothetical protein
VSPAPASVFDLRPLEPGTCHPVFAEHADTIRRWLDRTDPERHDWTLRMMDPERPVPPAWFREANPSPTMAFPTITLTRMKAGGQAPWAGRPFRYEWWIAVDEQHRQVAGDVRMVWEDGESSEAIPASAWGQSQLPSRLPDRRALDDVRELLFTLALLAALEVDRGEDYWPDAQTVTFRCCDKHTDACKDEAWCCLECLMSER